MDICRLVVASVATVAVTAGGVTACDPDSDAGGGSDPTATPTANATDDGDATEPVSTPGSTRSPSACVPIGNPLADALAQGRISYRAEPPGDNGLARSDEVTVRTGPASVAVDGRTSQSAEFTLDQQLTAKGEADLKKAGINVEAFVGHEVTYGFTGTTNQLRAVDWKVPPTPLDPWAIPVGGSVTVDRSAYGGLGLEVSYKLLRAGWEYAAGVRISTAVTRVSDDRVQVLVGPEAFVRESLKLGLGTDEVSVWFEHSREYARLHLEQAVFDLDSGMGRLRYYAMVLGGDVPEEDGDGVSDRATVHGAEYDRANELQLKVGELTAGLGLGSENLSYLVTDYTDGRRDYDISYREDDRSIVSHDEYADDDTRQLDQASYQLRMRAVRADALNTYNAIYANHRSDIGRPQNFVLTFTHDDFDTMRDQALEILTYRVNEYSRHTDLFPDMPNDATPSDVAEWIEQRQATGDTQALLQLEGLPAQGVQQSYDVATAPSDFAILHQIFLGGGGATDGHTLQWLWKWNMAVADVTGDRDAFGLGQATCVDTAASAPTTRTCPDIGFTPGSEDGAFDIKATGVPCAEVETLLREARYSGKLWGAQYTVRGFDCRRIREDVGPTHDGIFRCTQGSRSIRFVVPWL